jgi:Tfp pilus assembly protein PilE
MVTRNRAGLTLIEVAVSAVVLGTVLTTVAQVIQWSATEHRAAQRKRCALEAATAVLDQFTVRGWSEITPKAAAAIQLPADTTGFLLDPRLVVTVSEATKQIEGGGDRKHADNSREIVAAPIDSLPSKKIVVDVIWADGSGGRDERVELSTWVFPRESTSGLNK